MRAYYRSFGRLRGLVFGWFGEASDDVHQLINTLAHVSAVREAMRSAAKDETAAVGRMKAHLRRSIGMEAWRLRARHLLNRKMYIVGAGGERQRPGGRFGGDAAGETSQRFAASSADAAAAQKAARSARASAAAAAFFSFD